MLTASHSPQLESSDSKSHSPILFSHSPRSRRENSRGGLVATSSPIVKPYSTHVYSDTQRTSIHRGQPLTRCSPVPATTASGTTGDRSSLLPAYASSSISTRSIATQTRSPLNTTSTHPSMVDAGTQYSPPTSTANIFESSTLHAKVRQGDTSETSHTTSTPTTQIGNLQLIDTNSDPRSSPKSGTIASDVVMPSAQAGTTASLSKTASTRDLGSELKAGNTSTSSKRNYSLADNESQEDVARPLQQTKDSQASQNATVTADSTDAVGGDTDLPSSSKRARPESPPLKIMPRLYEHASTRDLVILISSMLMELIRYNDAIPLGAQGNNLTRFHSRAPPGISVLDYLQRLTTHATLSPPILLSMVYYIDKLCALYPVFTISSLTVHRFLITSATVASKGLSDSFWTNKAYARVGGVSVRELALLELEFLVRVQWRIVPQPEVLVDYYRSLVERSPGYKLEESQSEDDQASSKEPG